LGLPGILCQRGLVRYEGDSPIFAETKIGTVPDNGGAECQEKIRLPSGRTRRFMARWALVEREGPGRALGLRDRTRLVLGCLIPQIRDTCPLTP
jgi:hypothetical protein